MLYNNEVSMMKSVNTSMLVVKTDAFRLPLSITVTVMSRRTPPIINMMTGCISNDV
jgi:hypothetical protein